MGMSHEICPWCMLYCALLWLDSWRFLPKSFRFTSLALGQSYDCPSNSEVNLKNMGEWDHMEWMHRKWWYNHNKTRHSKTMCLYFMWSTGDPSLSGAVMYPYVFQGNWLPEFGEHLWLHSECSYWLQVGHHPSTGPPQTLDYCAENRGPLLQLRLQARCSRSDRERLWAKELFTGTGRMSW